MKIKQIAKIRGGQDGAIYGGYIFRFDSKGNCSVYDFSSPDFSGEHVAELKPIAEFTLDRVSDITPHSNSVVFGSERYEAGDEFPLLYTNVYNTYSGAVDKMCGVCCVYRITRDDSSFSSKLVGLITVDFTDDRELWRSPAEVADIRPYGNFVIDTENRKYWAYVMRDGVRETRYFRFALPSLADAEIDPRFGVPNAHLKDADIEKYFDAPYHNYVQGGVFHTGKVYEVEGFGKDVRAALRVINTEEEREELYFDFYDVGYGDEPEFIDFFGDRCVYIDAHGNVFYLEF